MRSSTQQISDPIYARYETLLAISKSIVSHRQLSSLLADLYRSLKQLIDFDFIGLCLYDEQRQVTRLHELITDEPVEDLETRERGLHETPCGVVLQTQEPYYSPNLERSQNYPDFDAMLLSYGVHSHCVLPLSTAQQKLGTLSFGSFESDDYNDSEIEFMGQVGQQVAVAVENVLNREAAEAYEQQLARERDRLRMLLDLNNAVVANLDAGRLFYAISACLKGSFRMEYASLGIYDPEVDGFRLHALDFPATR